jgi:predicted nuclease of restriction endonuclease-like (RecB) superfamily
MPTKRRAPPAGIARPTSGFPAGYSPWLDELKTRIRAAQVKAVLAANAELVLLYWSIGRDILARQEREGWGAQVIARLSADLSAAFPDMQGFSSRNLKYMRAFAAAWADEAIVQVRLAQLTWYHNLTLLEKVDGAEQRLWYARQAIEHGWSRNVLVAQIESGLHRRAGRRSRISRRRSRRRARSSRSRR